jgi:hypothetical protein
LWRYGRTAWALGWQVQSGHRQEVSKIFEKYINLILGRVYDPDCESENNFL